MASKIKVFIKRPDAEKWYCTNISNTLENLQKTVGGDIETYSICTDMVIICNEEGRLRELPFNCRLFGIDFVGTIIIAGVAGDEFCDVPITYTAFKRWFLGDRRSFSKISGK